jgi:hypothetical protein
MRVGQAFKAARETIPIPHRGEATDNKVNMLMLIPVASPLHNITPYPITNPKLPASIHFAAGLVEKVNI